MGNFPREFINAFNHAMLYEVGPFWDPSHPDVIAGRIETRAQRRKVGFVNIRQDRGGETKFGIAQNAHPNVRVRDLDLRGAMMIFYNEFWIRGRNHRIPYPLSILHFDGCILHGVRRANIFLQRTVNVNDDGIIGPITLRAVQSMPQKQIIQGISNRRIEFVNDIVRNDSSQQIFLNGWLRRIREVTEYALSNLS